MGVGQKFKDAERLEHIISVLAKYELAHVLKKPGFGKKKSVSIEAQKLKKVFEELGGGFLKLGQLLSLRPDLVPREYCNVLAELQDDVPGFSEKEARQIIKNEFGKTADKIFSNFNFKPLAAASIGQVHTATLKGKKVAVKIQRPKIREIFETDIEILEMAAKLIKKHFRPKVFDPEEIVQEFKRYTEDELDYLKEAKNIRDFYANAKETAVVIPELISEYTTTKILTMGFVSGKQVSKITDARSKKIVANRLTDAILRQVFVDGVFHADPHPGNVLLLPDNRIALLDFGIAGRIDYEMKKKLTNMFLGFMQRDLDEIATAMVDLNLVRASVNLEALKQDLRNSLGEYYDTSLSKVSFATLLSKVLDIARRNSIKVGRDYVLLAKAFVTLESVGTELDDDYNIVKQAEPFVKYLIRQRMKPQNLAKEMYRDARDMKRFILSIPKKADFIMEKLGEKKDEYDTLDRDVKVLTNEIRVVSSRVVLGGVSAALIIAAALISQLPQGAIFGFPEYSFYISGFALVIVLYLLLTIGWDRVGRR